MVTLAPHVEYVQTYWHRLFGGRTARVTMGVVPGEAVFTPVPPAAIFSEGAAQYGRMVWDMLTTIGQMITGQRSVEELGGPVRIAQYSGASLENGWRALLWFIALLSLNLGVVNLLPIPILDGGHLAMYGIQALRGGKPLSDAAQRRLVHAGLALIIVLATCVTYNDIRRVFS
jgi:regulator of sigma E protease